MKTLPRRLRRYRKTPWIVLALLAFGLVLSRFPQVEELFQPAPPPESGKAVVADVVVLRVIDGDTVDLQDGRRIRLIGIDTPEMGYSPRAQVEGVNDPFAEEATAFLRELAEGRTVRLEFGPEPEDRYGRTLAYLFLEDGAHLNAELLRRGYARAYRRFQHPRLNEFLTLEEEARQAERGLWADVP